MAVRLTVIGSSPAWPNPGGACSGYLVEGRLLLDCGPGVLAKLREREPWPTRRGDRDHAPPPRPLGRPRPVGLGQPLRPRRVAAEAEALAAAGQPRAAAARPRACSGARTCSTARSTSPSTSRACRSPPRGLEVTAVPVDHYDMQAYGFRVKGDRVLAYSGDSGPSRRARGARARRRPAPLRGDARERRLRRARRAVTSRPTRSTEAAADARALRIAAHAPARRAGRRRRGVELAYDGLELEF